MPHAPYMCIYVVNSALLLLDTLYYGKILSQKYFHDINPTSNLKLIKLMMSTHVNFDHYEKW